MQPGVTMSVTDLERIEAQLKSIRAELAEVLKPKPIAVSFAEAAKMLDTSTRTIRRMVADRTLLTITVGKTPKVPMVELQRITTPVGLGSRPEFGQRQPERREVRRLNSLSKARGAEAAKAAALVEARRKNRQR